VDGVSFIVYGDSKVGKSWLGDTTPRPRLVLDAEGGSRFTPSRKITWDPAAQKPPPDDGTWDSCLVPVHSYNAVKMAYDWLYSAQHPFNSVVLDSISEIQQKCYTPDTEVLTPGGWVRLDELPAGTHVAQADVTHPEPAITFCAPLSRQVIDYDGDIIDFDTGSRACRLAVTPDHRMAVSRSPGRYEVLTAERASASAVASAHARFPVAGFSQMTSATDVSDAQLQVITAFQADGSGLEYAQHPHSQYTAQWTFRKQRKALRLQQLLTAAGITYTTQMYQNRHGTSDQRISVKADDMKFVSYLLDPDKTWSWNALFLPQSQRQVLLKELQFWNGNSSENPGGSELIYRSTASKNIDVISAVASLTGYSATSHPGKGTVHLTPRLWARHSTGTRRMPYIGKVYCLTVPHGFLVVRRHGVTTICGNCVDDIAGTNPMQVQDWGTLLRTVSSLVRKYRDLITHPVKPLLSVTVIAMMDDSVLPKRPLMQGKMRSFMPYYFDCIGYLGVGTREDGTAFRRLLITPTPEYIAGERVGGRLGGYVDDPDISKMLTTVTGWKPGLPQPKAAVAARKV
jgi:AAA domain